MGGVSERNPDRQIVVCAACKLRGDPFPGLVICGARHWDMVMHQVMHRLLPDDAWLRRALAREAEQGFIDKYGNFLTREEALAIVKSSGQPFDAERNGSDTQLFSEGLY